MSASTTPHAWPSARSFKTERGRCAVAFLKAAVAYYKSLGITVLRVMTDRSQQKPAIQLPVEAKISRFT